jgi:3-hydroxyacyl-[acyl-carrier-protein] dehydratase
MDDNTSLSFIKSCQQNRYPLLFVDRITECEPGKRVRAIKNFTYNEWFFPAHFEDDPNVPGFIQIECLTQVFIMTFLTLEKYRGEKTAFLSLDDVKFSRKLIPGDTLEIEANLDSFRFGVASGWVESWVGGESAARARLSVGLPSVLNKLSPRK